MSNALINLATMMFRLSSSLLDKAHKASLARQAKLTTQLQEARDRFIQLETELNLEHSQLEVSKVKASRIRAKVLDIIE